MHLIPLVWLYPFAAEPWLNAVPIALTSAIILFSLLAKAKSRKTDPYTVELAFISLIFFIFIASPPVAIAGSWDRALGAVWFITLSASSLLYASVQLDRGHQKAQNLYSKNCSAPTELHQLMTVVLIVSIANIVLQLIQVTGFNSHFDALVRQPYAKGSRPFANLGQPNLLATTLAWGMVAALWLLKAGRTSNWLAWTAGMLLAIGLGLTQSRTGLLSLGLVFLISLAISCLRATAVKLFVWTSTAFAVAFFSPTLYEWLQVAEQSGGGTANLVNLRSASIRLDVWSSLYQSLLQDPWIGSGLNTSGMRHLEALSPLSGQASHRSLFVYAHNIVLDFALWIGLAPTLLLLAGVIFSIFSFIRRQRSTEQWLLALFLTPFLVHSMLEMPHAYLSILAVACVVLGYLVDSLRAHVRVAQNRQSWASKLLPHKNLAHRINHIALASIIIFGCIFWTDYLKLRQAFVAIQFEARFVIPPGEDELNPNFIILRDWGPWLQLNRRSYSRGCESVSALSNSRLEQVMHVYPTASTIARVAYCLDVRGDHERAEFWREKICAVAQDITCKPLEVQSVPRAEVAPRLN